MIDNNLADYADPIIYDQENNSFEPDAPFFLEMACQAGGPVLDLGCGSGRFATGLFFPHPEQLEDVPEAQEWFSYTTVDGRDVDVSGTEYYDPLRQVKVETAVRRWTNKDGKTITREAPLALRYVYPQEMETLLYYNGFTILNVYGDWDESPLTAESRMMVYVCKKRT